MVQFSWPLGMPLVAHLKNDIWVGWKPAKIRQPGATMYSVKLRHPPIHLISQSSSMKTNS